MTIYYNGRPSVRYLLYDLAVVLLSLLDPKISFKNIDLYSIKRNISIRDN